MKSNLIQILAVILVSCALTSLGTVCKIKSFWIVGILFCDFKTPVYIAL